MATQLATNIHDVHRKAPRRLVPGMPITDEMAKHLVEMHDSGSYFRTHTTWARYCESLGFNARTAYRRMNAVRAAN